MSGCEKLLLPYCLMNTNNDWAKTMVRQNQNRFNLVFVSSVRVLSLTKDTSKRCQVSGARPQCMILGR
eukprot:1303032-Amphidinium_carterae.2